MHLYAGTGRYKQVTTERNMYINILYIIYNNIYIMYINILTLCDGCCAGLMHCLAGYVNMNEIMMHGHIFIINIFFTYIFFNFALCVVLALFVSS
jgi:hypothetical protein